jgi:hypothetical protein
MMSKGVLTPGQQLATCCLQHFLVPKGGLTPRQQLATCCLQHFLVIFVRFFDTIQCRFQISCVVIVFVVAFLPFHFRLLYISVDGMRLILNF